MNKTTFRDVIISSLIFLLLVFGASLFINKFNLINNSKATAVSSEHKKIVYLTFDDGPSVNTQSILDVLDNYKVKATFFVTGENLEYANLIFEEAQRGHSIGVHTYSHDYGKIYSSTEAYVEDMDKINLLIKKQIGHRVNIFRFPGGASNTVSRNYRSGIMSELSKVLQKKGYQYYDWNASNGDGDSYASSDYLVQRAIKEIGDKDEVMFLMHDGAGNKATVTALPRIIEHLKSKGYEFKVIDNSTPVFHHHIAN